MINNILSDEWPGVFLLHNHVNYPYLKNLMIF